MADRIIGDCSSIVDRDTFELKITHIDKENQSNYNETERIQVDNLPDDMDKLAEEEAKNALGLGLNGRSVICHVKSKKDTGTLLCDVFYWQDRQQE